MRADGVQHARAARIAEVHRQVLRLARLQSPLGQINPTGTASREVYSLDANVLTGPDCALPACKCVKIQFTAL